MDKRWGDGLAGASLPQAVTNLICKEKQPVTTKSRLLEAPGAFRPAAESRTLYRTGNGKGPLAPKAIQSYKRSFQSAFKSNVITK